LTDIDQGGHPDTEVVRQAIAHHAWQALNRTVRPDGAMLPFGDESWAKARWHAHIAAALRDLAAADPAAAAEYVRERLLDAFKPPGQAS